MTIVIRDAPEGKENAARCGRRTRPRGLAAILKGLPAPAKARKIAIQSGRAVGASNNTYILPMSAADERKLGDEQNLVGEIYRAMQLLAKPGITGKQMVALGEKHFCRDLHELARDGAAWLLRIADSGGGASMGGGTPSCR